MAISKTKKNDILMGLGSILKNNETFVFVSFDKMTMPDTQKLRKLGETSNYMVTKKTLLRKALDTAGFEGEMPTLDGKIAISYGKDKLEPANIISKFQKLSKTEDLKIVGGVFEGGFADASFMNDLASIGTLKEVQGKFVNIINFPIKGFVSVLNQVAISKN